MTSSVRSAPRAGAQKKRTSNGKWNRKHPKKVAIEKLATQPADLRAELEAARREVRAMRATADGLIDQVIKLKAEKAALKTELTTRTTARSHTLAYKTEEAGRYREKLVALEGGIIEILRHERE